MDSVCESLLEDLLSAYPSLSTITGGIREAFSLLVSCYANCGKVMVCGNGGSAADAEHIVGELMKGFMLGRTLPASDAKKIDALFPEDGPYISSHLQGALPAISLVSQSALISAFANDVSSDLVFAQQVYGYAHEGDLLIGLSTSGNSKNVVNAMRVAKALGCHTLGFTGQQGGAMNGLCDVLIKAPASETYKVQELHLPIYHTLCSMVEMNFFGHACF